MKDQEELIIKNVVAITKTFFLNDIVTIDLKEYGEGPRKYVMYAKDNFSRLTVLQFIADKKAETIGQFLLEKWISVFGRMQTLHSDRGGKLVNSEISRLAEYLDDKISNTTAYSTNQKGSNIVNRTNAVFGTLFKT